VYHRRKAIGQKVFLAITVPVASLSATFILFYIFMPQHNSVPLVTKDTAQVAHDVTPAVQIASPVQLKINSINVSAAINPVGLTAAGDMDIAENPEQVAWYKLGPKPGETGSAVIAGHYGWKDGVSSIFNDLNKLVKGDQISTVGEDGKLMTFVVSHTATYDPKQDTSEVFRSSDAKAHLNLITCQGTWENTQKTYSRRLVIFSDLLNAKNAQ
jgi:LPXTG-site transpeptidase (sortase) family protein